MTYKKIPGVFQIGANEKLIAVIALGHGETQGATHKVKSAAEVSNLNSGSPAWFKAGVETALLAPTAVNQQKFKLTLENGKVSAKAGMGFYAKVDLGIVKYHFEAASGKKTV